MEGYMEPDKTNYQDGYSQSKVFEKIMAPETLDFRFFNVDVGYGMMLWASLGDLIGFETPLLDAMITIIASIMRKDYKLSGSRTVSNLGLTREIIESI